jgi:hypothetical protein
MVGNGLLGPLLGVHAGLEGLPMAVIGFTAALLAEPSETDND